MWIVTAADGSAQRWRCAWGQEPGRPHPYILWAKSQRREPGAKPHLRRRLMGWPEAVTLKDPSGSGCQPPSVFLQLCTHRCASHGVSPTEPHFRGLVRNVTVAVKLCLMKSGTSCILFWVRDTEAGNRVDPEGRWEVANRDLVCTCAWPMGTDRGRCGPGAGAGRAGGVSRGKGDT